VNHNNTFFRGWFCDSSGVQFSVFSEIQMSRSFYRHPRHRSLLAARGLRGPGAVAPGARVGCAVRGAAADRTGGQRVTLGRTVHGSKNCRATAHERTAGTTEGFGFVDGRWTFEITLTPALSRSTGRGGRNGFGPQLPAIR
jgi:hypothetical protein